MGPLDHLAPIGYDGGYVKSVIPTINLGFVSGEAFRDSVCQQGGFVLMD